MHEIDLHEEGMEELPVDNRIFLVVAVLLAILALMPMLVSGKGSLNRGPSSVQVGGVPQTDSLELVRAVLTSTGGKK